MSDEEAPLELQSALQAFFHAREPEARFLEALGQRLIERADTGRLAASRGLGRAAARYVLAGLGVALLAALLVVGPQRVIAALARWTGYVPGLGVVELAGARALPVPVSRAEKGVTFSIDQFVASPDETLLVVRITGIEGDQAVSPRTIWIEWPGGTGLRLHADMSGPSYPACEPQGCPQVMQPDGFVIRKALDALPAGVDEVTLVWLPQGKVPGTTALEEWRFDLILKPIGQMDAAQWMVSSYDAGVASGRHHGIELRVNRVFQSSEATLVEMQIQVPEGIAFASIHGALLQSDLGGPYRPTWPGQDLDEMGVPLIASTPAAPGGLAFLSWSIRLRFEPGEVEARAMTLRVEGVEVRYSRDDEFPVIVGANPRIGDVIPLDVRFEVDGLPIHIRQARIVEATSIDPLSKASGPALEFLVESPVGSEDRRLLQVWFAPNYNQTHAMPFVDQRTGLVTERLGLNLESAPAPVIMVRLAGVVVDLSGPWLVSWPVPEMPARDGP